ncbi:MAG: hypothetical protein M1823_002596 [Watsoniomyces obsoletus]|nr:MAG: hypothetical protein M1823_002596 [Watsoniomyces obsoletus]
MGKASKDKRDAYYRLAKEQGWRARSAFKLLQLNEEFHLFDNVTRVVDLCAAPGSWSQVLSRVLIEGETIGPEAWQVSEDEQSQIPHGSKTTNIIISENGSKKTNTISEKNEETRKTDIKIVAIDLQPMTPLKGITTLTADITHSSTIPLLLQALDPDNTSSSSSNDVASSRPVDLVLSDGAPDVIGLQDFDSYIQTQLLFSALNVALHVLKPGGTFISKIFRTKDVDITYAQLRVLFNRVTVAKPRASRASSVEAFVVCRDFRPPADFESSWGKKRMLFGPGSNLQEAVESFWRQDISKQAPTRTIREDGVIELDLGDEDDEEGTPPRWIAPFVVCGDPSSSYDSDATYRLPKDRLSLDPVQPPTAPPYKRALEMRRAAGGAYGKTKNK